jgi:isoleucyl-tRNA synthetase
MEFKEREADEIRTLGKVLERGFLYRGLKPVNWSSIAAALAEAEVEYEDHRTARSTSLPADRPGGAREASQGVRSRSAAG